MYDNNIFATFLFSPPKAERIAVLLRCVEKKSIGNSPMTMAPLAHMFSELINATSDICPAVSTRAIVMLETIPKKVVKVRILKSAMSSNKTTI